MATKEAKPKLTLRERAEKIASEEWTISNILREQGPRQPGWTPCSATGYYMPIDLMCEQYLYGHYAITGGKPTYVIKKRKSSRKDELASRITGREIFVETPVTDVFDLEQPTIRVTKDSIPTYLDQGKLFSAQVRRHNIVHTTFNSGFSAHTGSKFLDTYSGLVFGIEIEMRFADVRNKLLFSKFVLDNYPEWKCERDGSLEDTGGCGDCGLELVTTPESFDYYTEHLPIVLEKAVSLGAFAYKAGNCYGIHITTNIENAQVGDRFVWLINAPQYRTLWQKIACRSGDNFNNYSGFKTINRIDGALNSQKVSHSDHYRATYARSANAVETRIFQSNLHPVVAISYIEVLKLLHMFCSQNDFDPNSWKEFLAEGASDNLNKFFADFGITQLLSEEAEEKFE